LRYYLKSNRSNTDTGIIIILATYIRAKRGLNPYRSNNISNKNVIIPATEGKKGDEKKN
jgi:hypothetical protein